MLLEGWPALIDAVAPSLLGPHDRQGQALADAVRELSEIYTRRRGSLDLAAHAHAARLRFFLLRDLLKIGGPLAELEGSLPEKTWRVLDLGAGLGTTTLGAATFAMSRGVSSIEVTAVERDARSLEIFRTLAERAHQRGLTPQIQLDARALDLRRTRVTSLPKADLILLGLALNELFPSDGADPDERLDPAERFLRQCLGRLSPGGRLIVVEPALRSTSRFLQRLRGRLSDRVVAPCLRAGPCPLLRRDRDWCHASLAFDLPAPLAETAKAAGLRMGRLTYAYLTLAADGTRLPGFAEERALRLVGGPMRSKGKTEWDGCGESGLVRLRLLDRERGPNNAALHGAPRGARIRLPAVPSGVVSLRLRPTLEIERI